MSKSQSAKADASRDRTAPRPSAFPAALSGNGLEAWMKLNESLLIKLGDVQQEAVRFIACRVEDDLAKQRELLACTSPTEFGEVYATFLRKMIADYTEEVDKISKLAGEIQSSCVQLGSELAAEPAGNDAQGPKA